MKKSILLITIFSLSISIFSQNKTLVSIDGENHTVSEFRRIYEKNLDAIDNDEAKDISKNLELFINYKLKVKEAYKVKLDTFPSYIKEINTYRNQLSAPYLQDTAFVKELVKEAYFRTVNKIKAKHILIRLPKNPSPKDTLVAFNKILKIRARIVNGADFENVAVEVSEDKSAQGDPKTGRKPNKGNLGYFSAFSMVFPFENAAYNTKVGEISMPLRTQYGYHIIKVDDLRPSKGEVEAAHIIITDTTSVGKNKIDEVFNKLKQNVSFEVLAKEYSQDERSKNDGGKLGVFEAGRMVKSFDEAIFGLTEINSYTKPFKTPFGWHIAKLLKKIPVKPFKELEEELTKRVKKSKRMQLTEKAIVNKLIKNYAIVESEEAKNILERIDLRDIPKDSLQKTIFSINNTKYTQEEFIKFIKNRKTKPVYELFENFKTFKIINYYKENLIHTEPEYAYTLKEYEDGVLLFELMQQKVWEKAANDSIGIQEFFTNNISNYTSKELKKVKGEVMNDYQNFLEKNWIADLRRKSKIKVNKKQLKKLIKIYEKK